MWPLYEAVLLVFETAETWVLSVLIAPSFSCKMFHFNLVSCCKHQRKDGCFRGFHFISTTNQSVLLPVPESSKKACFHNVLSVWKALTLVEICGTWYSQSCNSFSPKRSYLSVAFYASECLIANQSSRLFMCSNKGKAVVYNSVYLMVIFAPPPRAKKQIYIRHFVLNVDGGKLLWIDD